MQGHSLNFTNLLKPKKEILAVPVMAPGGPPQVRQRKFFFSINLFMSYH